MLKQETIKLNTSRKGTLGKFFTTYSGQTSEDGSVSYLLTDVYNQPIKIIESELESFFSRNNDNNYEPLTGVTIYTGTTIHNKFELLDYNRKLNITNNYIDNIQLEHLAQNYTGFTLPPVSFVEYKDVEIDDMFININLNRSIDTLDTLNVYNVPINQDVITNECKTGIVIGKLLARQKIFDKNGDPLFIPLRNTPVAIFTPSPEFPSTTSINEEGNRIALNIKENVNTGSYFNTNSLATDLLYLTDTSAYKNIPPQFKHTAITNDNGEFVIFDVPIGEQTFMYEVDLLKQGLTRDEVALNFFPYPATEKPELTEIPHFFFREIPINILPAWGDFQTGYTQLNVTINLDLRKWITYYISPISFNKKRIEEQILKGDNTPLIVQVRDMTKKNFDLARIELVRVENLIDKDYSQVLEWENEAASKFLTTKASYLTTDYHAIKVPANMYDPRGTNSHGQGNGVWLGGYQLKMFYKDSTIYKATGFERNYVNNEEVGSNHFDLNKGNLNIASTSPNLGLSPYERPWTIDYPEPYKIPSPPTQLNTNKQYGQQLGNPLVQTDPRYIDGDMAGGDPNPSDLLAWGYGAQQSLGYFTENIFARRVTQNRVYKYEEGVRWDELYSNGYNRYMTGITASHVVNGEKFQRVEAGFGYWLRPEGWPRIKNNAWGDTIAGFDVKERNGQLVEPISADIISNGVGPSSYADYNYKIQLNDMITIKMDSTSPIRQGGLDIYRVIKPEQVLPPEYFAQETFVDLDFEKIYRQDRISTFVDNNHNHTASDFYDGTYSSFGLTPNSYPLNFWDGAGLALFSSYGVVSSPQSPQLGFNQYGWPIIGEGEGGMIPHPFNSVRYKIKNTGIRDIDINIAGVGYTIQVGQTVDLYDIQESPDWTLHLRLPGNNILRGVVNKYSKASYEITIITDVPKNPNNPTLFTNSLPYTYENKVIIDTEADSIGNIPKYYLRSRLTNVIVPVLTTPDQIVKYASYGQIWIAGMAFADPVDGDGNSQDMIPYFLIESQFDKQRIVSDDPINFNRIPFHRAY